MSDTDDTAAAKRGTFFLLVLGICGAVMGVGFLVVGLVDLWAGRWFGSGGGFPPAVIGALLGLATVRVVGLWRKARGLLQHRPT